jgi:hypothetical protein
MDDLLVSTTGWITLIVQAAVSEIVLEAVSAQSLVWKLHIPDRGCQRCRSGDRTACKRCGPECAPCRRTDPRSTLHCRCHSHSRRQHSHFPHSVAAGRSCSRSPRRRTERDIASDARSLERVDCMPDTSRKIGHIGRTTCVSQR